MITSKKKTRLPLLREFENPTATIKIELWPGKVLVFGLNEKDTDYTVFDSFTSFMKFWNLNYDL